MEETAQNRAAQLPSDAISRARTEARKEGVFAGLTSGLASALLGQRLLGFNRNKTLFCGTLSAVLAGYMFTQAFTETAIAQLRAEEARLGGSGTFQAGTSPPSSA